MSGSSNTPDKCSVGIAGTGLMGRLIGVTLAKKGWLVKLFDKDDKEGNQSCGKIAAGMLAPYAELQSTEPLIFTLGQRSVSQWEKILSQLKQPVFFEKQGSLLLAHSQDSSELNRVMTLLNHKLPRSLTHQLNLIQHQANLRKIEPGLKHTQFSQALHLPYEAHLEAIDLFDALKDTLLAYDRVGWHEKETVQDVGPYYIATTRHSRHHFDWVIDCRGLGAKNNLPQLRGVRGELIRVHAPMVQFKHIIRLLHPRYPIYIAPKANHHFIIGASVIESEDTSPISVQTTLELLSAAYSVDKHFAEARIISSHVNCRPAFPDNLPRVLQEPGLIRVNGLYRHGYLLAPTLLEAVLYSLGFGKKSSATTQMILEIGKKC